MPFTPPSALAPNQQGVMVEYTDWNALLTFMIQTAGYAVAFGQANTAGNGVPQFQPLNCIPTTGMVISLGGTSSIPQWALIAGQLSAATSAQLFTVPNNSSGQTRIDIVAVQMQMLQGSTVSRPIEGDGNQNVPYDYAGVAYQYVEGTPGGGQPSPPAGYQTFAVLTIPTGTSTITSGMISIAFPQLNPTGPTGPQGPAGIGNTTLTGSANIPSSVGGAMALPVVSNAGFPVGSNGVVISGDASCAAYFSVTGHSAGPTLNCQNLGPVPGFPNTGTLTSGGTVGFGNGFLAYTVSSIPMPAPGTTALAVPVSNVGLWVVGQCGILVGPVNNNVFLFQITGVHLTAQTLDLYCITQLQGITGNTIGIFAQLYGPVDGKAYFQDGSPAGYSGGPPVQQPINYFFSGRASDPGLGNTVHVTLPLAFASANNYRVAMGAFGSGGGHSFSPQAINKTASGFDILIPNDIGTGHGDIEWMVMGWVVL